MMSNFDAPGLSPRRHRRRWLTVLAAMAAATATWGVAESLLDIDLAVRRAEQTVQEIDSLAVTLTSLAVGLAAWALLEVLERRTSNARLIWRLIASGVLVISMVGPLAAVTPAATTVLLIMHALVGGILIWHLPGHARSVTDVDLADRPRFDIASASAQR